MKENLLRFASLACLRKDGSTIKKVRSRNERVPSLKTLRLAGAALRQKHTC